MLLRSHAHIYTMNKQWQPRKKERKRKKLNNSIKIFNQRADKIEIDNFFFIFISFSKYCFFLSSKVYGYGLFTFFKIKRCNLTSYLMFFFVVVVNNDKNLKIQITKKMIGNFDDVFVFIFIFISVKSISNTHTRKHHTME